MYINDPATDNLPKDVHVWPRNEKVFKNKMHMVTSWVVRIPIRGCSKQKIYLYMYMLIFARIYMCK